jgi:hypothetical protein
MPTWKERYEILEKEGWTVCCESPFEIEHRETESTATGYAAQIIADLLLDEVPPEHTTVTITEGRSSAPSEVHGIYYVIKDVLETRLGSEVVEDDTTFAKNHCKRVRSGELFNNAELVILKVKHDV